MPLLKRSEKDVLEDAVSYLKQTGSSTAHVPGTPEHAIANLIAGEVSAWYNGLEYLRDGLMLSTATGVDLDRLAELVGIKRNDSTVAYDDSGKNVKFYIDSWVNGIQQTSDDLAAEIAQSSLTIPEGTEISNGAGKIYYVTADTTFAAGTSSVFVNVTAAGSGAGFNVDAGELKYHNLAAHPTLGPIASKLKVTNMLPISNGQYTEDDNSLRYRISQAFASQVGGNLTSILQAARSVPGVADAFVTQNIYGTGTFGVFIDSTTPLISPGLINAVQAAVDSVKPVGTRAYVLYPEYVGLQIKFDVIFHNVENTSDVTQRIENSLIDHINNLSRGETLYINKLVGIVSAFPEVRNARLKELKSGRYDVVTQTLENPTSLLPADQTLNITEKWFTASDLIDICEVK